MNPDPNSMSLVTSVRHAVLRAESPREGISIYLFGSACHASAPSDIDLLFVYDPSHVPPSKAYERCRPIMAAVEGACGIPVHPVVLTTDEERTTAFLNRVAWMPIQRLE